MSKNARGPNTLSRRDTFRVCLVPVGAFAARLLDGCADARVNPNGDTTMTAFGSGGAPAVAGSGGNASSSAGAGGAQAGSGAQASAGTGGVAAPSQPNAQPSAGSGGQAAQNPAGSGGSSALADAGVHAASDAGSNDGIAGPGVPWASGGTKSMKGGYPDPFAIGAAGVACKLYPAQTIGPCYADAPMTREDISDGQDGLPLRLSLLVVKSDGCTPVPNASVDVWHSGSQGIYSAYATGTICNPGTMDVTSEMFGRGVQTTDEHGRVDFSTVFPGWYTGRAIHIHFTIRLNGQESVTSQLYFEDALSDEICAQGQYAARGMRDTTNATDFIFSSGGGTPDEVLLETAKRPDGGLHAWKVLSLG